MTDLFVQIAGGAFLLAGSFFVVVGAIGLTRMPDLFTRMHAASVGETVGGSLLLIGMMIHGGLSLVTFKLVVLLGVIFFFGPVATHALARAARYAGVEPLLAGPAKRTAKPASKARKSPRKTRRKPAGKGRK